MILIGKDAWEWLQKNKDHIYTVTRADIEFDAPNLPFLKHKYKPCEPKETNAKWFKNDDGKWSTLNEEHSIILEVQMYNELL